MYCIVHYVCSIQHTIYPYYRALVITCHSCRNVLVTQRHRTICLREENMFVIWLLVFMTPGSPLVGSIGSRGRNIARRCLRQLRRPRSTYSVYTASVMERAGDCCTPGNRQIHRGRLRRQAPVSGSRSSNRRWR